MKPLYDKITDALKRMEEEDRRDHALAEDMRKALQPPRGAKWKLKPNDTVELSPEHPVFGFRVKKGKILLLSPSSTALADFDSLDKATDRVADLMGTAMRAYEQEEATRLEEQGWRRQQVTPSLYPTA